MSDEISWCVELEVSPTNRAAFCELTNEMVEFAGREPRTVAYERFMSDLGSMAWLYERYADSEAAIAHLRVFAEHFSERFDALVARRTFLVLGSPTRDLRRILDRFGPTYLPRLAGFSRMRG